MTKNAIFTEFNDTDVRAALKLVAKCPQNTDNATGHEHYWHRGESEWTQNVAIKLMGELITQGKAEFILLRDEDVQKWWTNLSANVRKVCEEQVKKREEEKIRAQALSKLTDEECKVLKIKRPKAKKV